MKDKLTREFDAHKALKREADKRKAPTREKVAPGNPFTIDVT